MNSKRPCTSTTTARWLGAARASLLAGTAALALLAGCLDSPVGPQEPRTSNVYVDQIVQTAVDKIDLLFMIDNSISMADKQLILGEAVPVLVERLVTPICLRPDGSSAGNSTGDGMCQPGSEAEFSPIKDIHIGIVTSSLGHHGGETCVEADDDDRGFLLAFPGIRTTPLTNWNNLGFLAWDPDGDRNTPAGIGDANTLINAFRDTVTAAGETGCGYEASLEAWYRFLIDPLPPNQTARDNNQYLPDGVTANPTFNQTIQGWPSTEILAQRAAFLRPDSLVAVIVLSDENDCSIVDFGQGWLVGLRTLPNTMTPYRMPRSTAICETDPNARCCMSCQTPPGSVPSGCADPTADASCTMNGGFYVLAEDHTNLRCFEQKRRFGFDLLYPISRYVDGLTKLEIYDRTNTLVRNPLFAAPDGEIPRDRSLVFLAGIIGVPWQDIADEESLAGPGLRYLTFQEMNDLGRWPMILGTPAMDGAAAIRPLDGLMYETTLDRSTLGFGPHPLTGDAIAPSTTAMSTLANPMNGHESVLTDGSDLQYACIFERDDRVCQFDDSGCDCEPGNPMDPEDTGDAIYNRALCNGSTQIRAKAYPGVRHLQLLRAFGDETGNAIVASICPKVLEQGDQINYGYNPAVAAIIERLKDVLQGKCLPRPLEVDAEGQVPCAVIEAQPMPAGGCPACQDPRITPMAPEIDPAVRSQLEQAGYCGDAGGAQVPCSNYCLCEIEQFTGDELIRCQTSETTPADISGYCYVDAAQGIGNELIVQNCPSNQPRLLRFTAGVPANNAITYIACIGAPLTDTALAGGGM